jgi:tRNA pseudouridine55 synthase/H/ACA ribonucleoprotein complex subunit 4
MNAQESKKSIELDGFIVIDKPKGPTSHQVDYWVRQILGIEKVGHIGTLDPGVTGVLVMALGKATKLIDIAHEQKKEYVGVMRLYGDVPEESIRKAFHEYEGEIYQIPPMRSAVARTLRKRTIYELKILEISGRLVLFRVVCDSGTYIRTLCTDLGYTLGVGAQMAELRRTKTGLFQESDMVTLQQITDAKKLADENSPEKLAKIMFSMDYLFRDYPKIIVKKSTLANISRGSDLFPGGIRMIIGTPIKGERVAVLSENNELVGTGIMMVNYNEILDLKVVDFDRVLLENPGQLKQKAKEIKKEVRPKPKVTRFGGDRERTNRYQGQRQKQGMRKGGKDVRRREFRNQKKRR